MVAAGLEKRCARSEPGALDVRWWCAHVECGSDCFVDLFGPAVNL